MLAATQRLSRSDCRCARTETQTGVTVCHVLLSCHECADRARHRTFTRLCSCGVQHELRATRTVGRLGVSANGELLTFSAPTGDGLTIAIFSIASLTRLPMA